MERLIKDVTKNVLLGVDSYATPLTDRKKLKSLIDKLRPVSFDKPLIRLGPQGDGGYLIPDDLEGIEACFSPGVDVISGFEKDCAERGMKVFLADKSVKQPAEWHENFHFTKKHIGVVSTDEFMTLDEWAANSLSDSQGDLLLQIDIEGYEYETFLATSESLMKRFRIIASEFHDLHMFWSKPFFRLASRAFEKILQTHACVHIHPNNHCSSVTLEGLEIPRVAEFTFIRRDRVQNPTFATTFPHPLDMDNNPEKLPITLPEWWYRGA